MRVTKVSGLVGAPGVFLATLSPAVLVAEVPPIGRMPLGGVIIYFNPAVFLPLSHTVAHLDDVPAMRLVNVYACHQTYYQSHPSSTPSMGCLLWLDGGCALCKRLHLGLGLKGLGICSHLVAVPNPGPLSSWIFLI